MRCRVPTEHPVQSSAVYNGKKAACRVLWLLCVRWVRSLGMSSESVLLKLKLISVLVRTAP